MEVAIESLTKQLYKSIQKPTITIIYGYHTCMIDTADFSLLNIRHLLLAAPSAAVQLSPAIRL